MSRGNEKSNSGSKIMPCSCKHAFQDDRFGVRNRVHTVGGNGQSPKYICTVCGVMRTDALRVAAKKVVESAPNKVASGKATKGRTKGGTDA